MREWDRKEAAPGVQPPSEEMLQQLAALMGILLEEGAKAIREDILEDDDRKIAIQLVISMEHIKGEPQFLAVATLPDEEMIGVALAEFVHRAMQERIARKN